MPTTATPPVAPPLANAPREVIYITDPPRPPSNGLGTTGFVFGILGIFTFGILSPIGLLFSFLGLFKKPRSFAAIGFLLSLAGTGFLASAAALPVIVRAQHEEAIRYQYEAQQTQEAIEAATEQIQLLMDEEATSVIDGFDGNAITIQHIDAWGQELRFDERSDGFSIRSAGPDGQFDTSDDIVQIHSHVPVVSAPPGLLSL